MTKPAPQVYAVRQVNPFEGVLQVVETTRARGYSANGVVWQIQVIAARPDHTWRSLGDIAPTRQFFNFGLWDPEDGLQQVLANPLMDIGNMMEAAEELIGCLPGLLGRLPFPLIDHYECWATDDQGIPVALLATAERPTLLRDIRVQEWQATRPQDHRFRSSTLDDAGISQQQNSGPRQHAEHLERLVRQRGPYKTWFLRPPQGQARRIAADGAPGEPIDPAFPPLGIKPDWHNARECALIHDYIDWIAPHLLLLPTLDDGLRATLERAACRRASALAAIHRLLPRILDKDAIEAARVEARLRRAAR